jgi:hypothetical protein
MKILWHILVSQGTSSDISNKLLLRTGRSNNTCQGIFCVVRVTQHRRSVGKRCFNVGSTQGFITRVYGERFRVDNRLKLLQMR